jgi:hypothetical protein
MDEFEFNAWLESITFVNENGEPVEPELLPDESTDPEGDRGVN